MSDKVKVSSEGKTGLGYEEMVWIRDKEGKQYACQFNDIKVIKKKEDLTEEESNRCIDVSDVLSNEEY